MPTLVLFIDVTPPPLRFDGHFPVERELAVSPEFLVPEHNQPFSLSGVQFLQLFLSSSQQYQSTEGNSKHWPHPVAWSPHLHLPPDC